MRVPCVARWPGAIPASSECGQVATAMDFLPTFAQLAGQASPDDRIVDGKNIAPMLLDPAKAKSPYDALFYYRVNELQAVRKGDWKLHLQTGELYNLREDVGETTDVAAGHAGIVADLERMAEGCRKDLGDSITGAPGENRRPCGRVDNPVPLTTFDPDHPYLVAMYD